MADMVLETRALHPGLPYLAPDQPLHQAGMTYWLLLWHLWRQGQEAVAGQGGAWQRYREN